MAQTILCPYCGLAEDARAERCGGCGGFFDDLSRRVTQQHMGPWFVRDPQQPFRPGCTYEILVKQIQRGKVTAQTPLRGPTTRQFWMLAKQVPGVAHLVGFCSSCGATVPKDARQCQQCSVVFEEPVDRNALGLAPVDPGLGEEVEKARAAEAAAAAAAAAAAPPPITSKPATSTGMPTTSPLRAASATGAQIPIAQAKQSGIRPPTASGIPRTAATASGASVAKSGSGAKSASGVNAPGGAAPVRAAASASGAAKATVVGTTSATAPPQPSRAPSLGTVHGEALPWMTGNTAPVTAAPVRKGGGLNKWIIAFLVLNAILVIAVVGLLLMPSNVATTDKPKNDDNGKAPATSPEHPAPAKPQDTPTPTATVKPPVVVKQPEVQPQPKPTPKPDPVTPPTPPVVVEQPKPTPPAVVETPAQPSTPDSGSGKVSFFGITVNKGGISDQQAALINGELAKANDLYKADKLEEAKAVLLKLKAQLGAAAKTSGIDDAIKTVSDKIHKKELDQFFNPTPPK